MPTSLESPLIQDIEFVVADSPLKVKPAVATLLDPTDGYVRYQERGGLLPEKRYLQIAALFNDPLAVQEKDTFSTREKEVMHLAQVAGVELNMVEIAAYDLLRKILEKGNEQPVQNGKPSPRDVHQLTDQELLGAILFAFDELDKLRRVEATYKAAFSRQGQSNR